MSSTEPHHPLRQHSRLPDPSLLWPAVALVAVLVCVAGLGYGQLAALRDRAAAPVTAGVAAGTPAEHPATVRDYARLATSELFGRYDPATDVAAATEAPAPVDLAQAATPPEELPEATLGIALKGVVYLASEAARRAIIDAGDGEPVAYAIGDSLPGEAVIRFIEARRIVVEHGGELKAVSLPEISLDTPAPPLAEPGDNPDAVLPQAGMPSRAARFMAARRGALPPR